jgi:hypothetical protein
MSTGTGRRRRWADLALGQHPQQPGLQAQRHVADLVEEQRAAVGRLDQPALGPRPGAGEAAGQVAEQLALDQALGDGRAVDGDEGLRAALAGGVQGLGEVFLAAAGLAGDQQADRAVDQARGALDLAVEPRIAARQRGQRRRAGAARRPAGVRPPVSRGATGGGMASMNSSCPRRQHHRPLLGRPRGHEAAQVAGRTSSSAGSGWPSSGRPASAGWPCSSSWARRLWPISRPPASSASR